MSWISLAILPLSSFIVSNFPPLQRTAASSRLCHFQSPPGCRKNSTGNGAYRDNTGRFMNSLDRIEEGNGKWRRKNDCYTGYFLKGKLLLPTRQQQLNLFSYFHILTVTFFLQKYSKHKSLQESTNPFIILVKSSDFIGKNTNSGFFQRTNWPTLLYLVVQMVQESYETGKTGDFTVVQKETGSFPIFSRLDAEFYRKTIFYKKNTYLLYKNTKKRKFWLKLRTKTENCIFMKFSGIIALSKHISNIYGYSKTINIHKWLNPQSVSLLASFK